MNIYLLRKKLLIFLLLITAAPFAFAQNDFSVGLKSGSFTPPANSKTVDLAAADFVQYTYLGRSYVVIQFNELPSEAVKKKMNDQGIEFLDYLPTNAYVVAVPADLKQSVLSNLNIRSIFTLQEKDKAFTDVLQARVPAHAIKATGYADVRILTYELFSVQQISNSLQTINARVVEEFPMFKNFIVRVPSDKLDDLVSLPFVQWAEFIDPPNEPENVLGRSLHRVNILQDGLRNLKGNGMNIGVFDEIASQHLDFLPAGRLINQDAGGAGSHGTHVSGTIGSKGIINPIAKGMAPNATIHSYYGFSGDVQARMALEIPSKTLISSNHSYHDGLGVQCGVTGTSAGYSLRARNTDLNLNNFLYHMHCHSSGNAQTSCASGWGTITGTGKAAKNNIVVGNITSTEGLSGSSSCGPVHDGRVKPEIVGMGTNVFSTYTPVNTYATISGTSMSTPGITGTVALLAQHYKQVSTVLPPSMLIKNIICNTATDLGTTGPDYRFGFGRIDALRAIKVLEENRYVLNNVATAVQNNITINVPAGATSLNVMLTWNDPAAAANAAAALVNNLDLTVVNGATTSLPWILNPAIPANAATQAVDNISNIEQVTIVNPPGGTYTLSVNGTSVPVGGTQAYALSWNVDVPFIEVIYPNGAESFTPGVAETITWNNAGVTGTQTVEYSLTGAAPWTVINTVSATTTRLAWTVPAANTPTAKIRISSGVLADQTDGNFTIMNRVASLTANNTSCAAEEINFSWPAATNATHYDLYKLNSTTGEFELLIANVAGTNYTATAQAAGTTAWFTIRAKDNTTGAVSERAIAISASGSNGGGGLPALGSISGPTNICGAQSNLTYSISPVPGATSYSWTVPAGGTINSGQGTASIIVSFISGSSSGNVAVSASNGSCSTAPATLAITGGSATISAPLSGGNQSQTVCAGASIPTLTATATASSGTTLRWYTQATGGSIVAAPVLNSAGTVTYHAAAYDNISMCESNQRTPVTLSIAVAAAATASVTGTTTFCQGGSAVITASSGSSYAWSNGATTQSITVTTSGNYSCVVTSGTCSSSTSPIVITMNARPTAAIAASGPLNFCSPGTVTLTASAGQSYVWSNGATTPSITLNTSGSYSVVVTNAAGCTSNNTATAAVNVSPQPTVTIAAVPLTKLLPGQTTTISATATPTGTYTYTWYKEGVAVAGANSSSISVNLEKIGSYSVAVTNAGGCSKTSNSLAIADSASSQLYILPNPNTGRFTVMYYSNANTNYNMRIFDSKGAAVFSKKYAIGTAYQSMPVEMRQAASGTYIIALYDNAGKQIASGKVLIQ